MTTSDSGETGGASTGDGDGSTTATTTSSGDGDGDSTSATTGSSCGNGVVDGSEQCDGADLNGNTCESLGFPSGTLTCSACNLDTSGCGSGTTTSPTTSTSATTSTSTSFTTGTTSTTGDGDGDGDYVGPYSNCGFPDVALICDDLGETSCITLSDMATMVETGRVCYTDCTPPSTATCPTALPPGGTATISCQALVGTGECVLDCSGGQICPTGMSCINSLFCGWT
jgi:hypothetical protein